MWKTGIKNDQPWIGNEESFSAEMGRLRKEPGHEEGLEEEHGFVLRYLLDT